MSDELMLAAMRGDVEAMFRLGSAYATGSDGVSVDLNKERKE